jgi:RNA polymerase sigma factor (TIGR02999 family)
METPGQVTPLLRNLDNGGPAVFERLLPLLHNELRRLAAHYMQGEKSGQTIQATELVHEACLQLVGQQDLQWQGKAHFMAVAATSMRRILIDKALGNWLRAMGGGEEKVKLDEALVFSPGEVKKLSCPGPCAQAADAVVARPGPRRRPSLFSAAWRWKRSLAWKASPCER